MEVLVTGDKQMCDNREEREKHSKTLSPYKGDAGRAEEGESRGRSLGSLSSPRNSIMASNNSILNVDGNSLALVFSFFVCSSTSQ
jgi:hypothetical protein